MCIRDSSWALLLGEADAEGDAEGGVVHGEGGGAHERVIHIPVEVASVSYTHLDVYKRQDIYTHHQHYQGYLYAPRYGDR